MFKYELNYTNMIHLSKVRVSDSKKTIVYYFDNKIDKQTFANQSDFDDAVQELEDAGLLLIGETYFNVDRLSIAAPNGKTIRFSFIGNVNITHVYEDATEVDDVVSIIEPNFIFIDGKWYQGKQIHVAMANPATLEIDYDYLGMDDFKVVYDDQAAYDEALDKLAAIAEGGGATSNKVKTPRFTPAAGGVTSGTTVTITCATSGATIHYTTDGTAPTASSPTYSTPIAITADTTIKAIAVKEGMDDSSVGTANYTIVLPKVANPVFTPSAGEVTSGTEVTISCATSGATIYYTTDGSTPTEDSTEYTAPITVTAAVTIKAIGVATDYQDSSVVTAAYTIGVPTAAAPIFTPVAGEVSKGTTVTLATTTPGGEIHYTTNGSTPTASSPVYTDPIVINADTTIKALTVAEGYRNSSVATAAYTVPAVTLYRYVGDYNMVDDGEGDVDPRYKLTAANAASIITGLSWLEENIYNDNPNEEAKLPANTRAWGSAADEKTIRSNAQAEVGYQIMYAYPASLGELIKCTNNGFDNTGSYTHVTLTLDGEEYLVYFLTNATGMEGQNMSLSFN